MSDAAWKRKITRINELGNRRIDTINGDIISLGDDPAAQHAYLMGLTMAIAEAFAATDAQQLMMSVVREVFEEDADG